MQNRRIVIQHLVNIALTYLAVVAGLLLSWYFAKLIIDPFVLGQFVDHEAIALGTVLAPLAAALLLPLVYLFIYLFSWIQPTLLARGDMIKVGTLTGIAFNVLFTANDDFLSFASTGEYLNKIPGYRGYLFGAAVLLSVSLYTLYLKRNRRK